MVSVLLMAGSAAVVACQDLPRTVVFTEHFRVLGDEGEVEVLHLKKGADTLSAGQVLQLGAEEFEVSQRERFQFGYTKHGHWLRFRIAAAQNEAAGADSLHLTLNLANPYLEKVAAFLGRNGMAEPLPLSLPGRNLRFPIRLAAGDTATVLLHIPFSRYPLDFKLALEKLEPGRNVRKSEEIILIVFFCLWFVYLLQLGLAIRITRLRYFWNYFAYVLLVGVFVFADLGLGRQVLWGHYTYPQLLALPFLTNAYLIFGVRFVQLHFQTPRRYPIHDQVLKLMRIMVAGLLPVALFLPVASLGVAHFFSYLHTVLYILTCVALFWLAVTAIRRRDKRSPGLLLIGFLVHGASILYTLLEWLRIVPPMSWTSQLAAQGIVFSLHTPLVLLLGLLIEMGVILYIGIRQFRLMLSDMEHMGHVLAAQKQQQMNALVLGMESEQKRIARELHDGLGGSLTALKFKLEHLLTNGEDTPTLRKKLAEVVVDITVLQEELRTIAHNLMPKPLYKLGLLPAVEQLLQRFRRLNPRLELHFFHNVDLQGIDELPKIYLFRIVQELLNNLHKHSKATEAWLQFVRSDGLLLITLEDNGQGFQPKRVLEQKKGLGLGNIRYRVEEALGGRFSIESTPGQGTVVSIEIPLRVLRHGKQHLYSPAPTEPAQQRSPLERWKKLLRRWRPLK